MYPVAPRHNVCLGPGVVSAAQMPLDAAHAYQRSAGPCLIQPTAGGPAFSVAPTAPSTHTTCVAPCAAAAAPRAGRNPRARAERVALRCAPLARYPYVTGTSVLAVKYADGVMMASDMLGASRCVRLCAFSPVASFAAR
jgi:hypothetical protein